VLIVGIAGSGRGEEPSGENVLRLIQVRVATPSLDKSRVLVMFSGYDARYRPTVGCKVIQLLT
jgi:hypothetical protein